MLTENTATETVQKHQAAMQQLREHREDNKTYTEPAEFDPSPTNPLGIRAHAIKKAFNNQNAKMLAEYLSGLGFVREHLIAARDVLHAQGKKKYEAYIKATVEMLPTRFSTITPYYMGIITDLMTIPFRRSIEKDKREISDSLCLTADFIEKYRYRGTDDRYRAYAQSIVRGIDTEQLPPMVAGLIIHEVTELVDAAYATNVMTFVNSGITHEEYWRYTDPDEYIETYPDGEVPDDASPLDALDIYPPHEGIAHQSLWYGFDIYVDDFIVSLAGGLLNLRCPSMYPSTTQKHQ